jgi:hypothetical protein
VRYGIAEAQPAPRRSAGRIGSEDRDNYIRKFILRIAVAVVSPVEDRLNVDLLKRALRI